MKLRESMLINGILYNSEAWHGVTLKQINSLESIDEALLRGILKSHSKTPKEFLYLELGVLPLRWILAQRRIMFMKHIETRHDEDLLKKVYLAQKENKTRGNLVELVTKDLKSLQISYDEVTSSLVSKEQLKKKLKARATNVAFEYLKTKPLTHTKVKSIGYSQLEMQHYLYKSDLSSEEIVTLAAFRPQCVKGIRNNFKKMYGNNIICPLVCDSTAIDTQDHLISCTKLIRDIDDRKLIKIQDIYGQLEKQEVAATLLTKLIKRRNTMLDKIEDPNSSSHSLPKNHKTLAGSLVGPD